MDDGINFPASSPTLSLLTSSQNDNQDDDDDDANNPFLNGDFAGDLDDLIGDAFSGDPSLDLTEQSAGGRLSS